MAETGVLDDIARAVSRRYRSMDRLIDDGERAQILFQIATARRGKRLLRIGEEDWVDFSTSSYLGLDSHASVIEASTEALREQGLNRYSTRTLLSSAGYTQLECLLAKITGFEDAIVFSTTTILHNGVLPLLTVGCRRVLMDETAHWSMRGPLRYLRRRLLLRTRHNDVGALDAAMRRDGSVGPTLVVTDGVFSLSGELAPVHEICQIVRRSKAALYVDDAHGFGVFGERGEGVLAHIGDQRENIVYVGSLSKALGCFGAFVACKASVARVIRRFSSGMMFTGALPPVVLAGATAACQMLLSSELRTMQARLWANQRGVLAVLRRAGLEPIAEGTATLCVEFTESERDWLLQLLGTLRDRRIAVGVVGFPAVPRGRYILRICVCANHSIDDIQRLGSALAEHGSRPTASDTHGHVPSGGP